MRIRAVLLWTSISLCLIPLKSVEVASADSANPPRIISISQISKGPYRPGDVLTIKVNYVGGYPGIDYMEVAVREAAPAKVEIKWPTRLLQVDPSYTGYPFGGFQLVTPSDKWGNGVLSTVLSGCTANHYIYSVRIRDKTMLWDEKTTWKEMGVNQINGDIDYSVVSDFCPFKPGDIRPEPLSDEIDLSQLGDSIKVSSSSEFRFKLPRLSKNGAPVFWSASSQSWTLGNNGDTCRVEVPFPEDAGGVLVADARTTQCRLYVDTGGAGQRFSLPLINSKLVFEKANNNLFPRVANIPIRNLDVEAKAKADAEVKAKADAEVKAKADAEVKAKELAEKPACDTRKKDLFTLSQEFLKFKKANPSKSEEVDSTLARLNSALKSNCVAEVTLADFQREYQDLTKSSSKKTTITCVKGKLTKKVTAINPKCPAGYKKK